MTAGILEEALDSADSTCEVVGNFHVHTLYSDGTGTHREVAQAAARAGLDVLMFTDHNVWSEHHTGWYADASSGRKVLLLMGQEVHDETLSPSINHYLCLGADGDVHTYAREPQALIDACRRHGGAGFIAHPIDPPAPMQPKDSTFPWLDWNVSGYTGIEVWNYMSEFKWTLTSVPRALLALVMPRLFATGPFPETLTLWDKLLSSGQRVVGIGNADAHAHAIRVGPIVRRLFEYEDLFKAVNTHLLIEGALAENWAAARQQVLGALADGHAFVAYDGAASARGFRFVALGPRAYASMGDEVRRERGLTLYVNAPKPATMRLIRDGQEAARTYGRQLEYRVGEPGVFRVEVGRPAGGGPWVRTNRPRVWILSNPIYVRA